MSKIVMFLERGVPEVDYDQPVLLARYDGRTDGLFVSSLIIDGVVNAFTENVAEAYDTAEETLRAVAVLKKHACDGLIAIRHEGIIRGDDVYKACEALCAAPSELFGKKAELLNHFNDCRVVTVIYDGELQPQV